MIYTIIAVVFSIIALLSILIATKILLNRKWIAGFIRGISGIALVVVAILISLLAKDISSFSTGEVNQTIVTVSFKKKEGGAFHVDLQEPFGDTRSFEVDGQQWQLTARVLRWSPLFGAMGFRPGYKLESFSGRFMELQLDSIAHKREAEQLTSRNLIDFWQILSDYPAIFSFVVAQTSTSGYANIADGAIFNVTLSGKDLTVNPLNDIAKTALKSW